MPCALEARGVVLEVLGVEEQAGEGAAAGMSGMLGSDVRPVATISFLVWSCDGMGMASSVGCSLAVRVQLPSAVFSALSTVVLKRMRRKTPKCSAYFARYWYRTATGMCSPGWTPNMALSMGKSGYSYVPNMLFDLKPG